MINTFSLYSHNTGYFLIMSSLASHNTGCFLTVSPLASHNTGSIITVSPLASHDTGCFLPWKASRNVGPSDKCFSQCRTAPHRSATETLNLLRTKFPDGIISRNFAVNRRPRWNKGLSARNSSNVRSRLLNKQSTGNYFEKIPSHSLQKTETFLYLLYLRTL